MVVNASCLEVHQDGLDDIILEVPVEVKIAVTKRPHFSISWSIFNENKVEDQVLLDQPRLLRLELTNEGPGSSLPMDISIFKDDDPFVSLNSGSTRNGRGGFRRHRGGSYSIYGDE